MREGSVLHFPDPLFKRQGFTAGWLSIDRERNSVTPRNEHEANTTLSAKAGTELLL